MEKSKKNVKLQTKKVAHNAPLSHKKPTTSKRKKSRLTKKNHRSSMCYNYPQNDSNKVMMNRTRLKATEGSIDIDPFIDEGYPQGQLRVDQTTFKIKADACSTYAKYSTLEGMSATRGVWRMPITYKNTAAGAKKIDQRGLLVDVEHAELTFRNMIHGVVHIKGNSPRTNIVGDGTLITSRPNPFDFILAPGQSKTVHLSFGNKLLRYKPVEFNLPDPASPALKQRHMALVDYMVVIPTIDEFDGSPYDAEKEMVGVDMSVTYITTMAYVGDAEGEDPAVTQIIKGQTLGLQFMGPDANVFHVDPELITLEEKRLQLLRDRVDDQWVVMRSVGPHAGGVKYGDYTYLGAKSIFTTLDKICVAVERVLGIVSLVASFL